MSKIIYIQDYKSRNNFTNKKNNYKKEKITNIRDYKYKFTSDFGYNMKKMVESYKLTHDEVSKLLLEVYCIAFSSEVENIVNNETDEEMKEELGIGFILAKINYEDYPIVIDFIARHMVEEIYLDGEDFNLEAYLHNRFNDPGEIMDIGIDNYIINYIYGYDKNLSGYVSCHLDIIDSIKKRIELIINNWIYYEEEIVDGYINIMEVVATEYSDLCDTEQLVYYAKYNLGVNVEKFYLSTLRKELENYGDELYIIEEQADYYNTEAGRKFIESMDNNATTLLKELFKEYQKTNKRYDSYDIDYIIKNRNIIKIHEENNSIDIKNNLISRKRKL